MSIFNLVWTAAFLLALVWLIWAAVKWWWPAAETSSAGQLVGKLTDTSQAYTIYGLLEAFKLDNEVKKDANALGAIAYLQSVALRGVAKDWTVVTDGSTRPAINEKPVDTHADTITWEPKE